jgi:hypothetical protein
MTNDHWSLICYDEINLKNGQGVSCQVGPVGKERKPGTKKGKNLFPWIPKTG